MNDWMTFYPFLFFYVFFLGLVFFSLWRNSQKVKQFLAQQAEKRDGRLKYNLFYGHYLVFQREGEDFRLYLERKSKNAPLTPRLVGQISSPLHWHLYVLPKTFQFQLKALAWFLRGGKRCALGNQFDNLFLLHTNDEIAAVHFLTPAIQDLLCQYRGALGQLFIKERELEFSLSAPLENEQQYDNFIEAGIRLKKRLYS